MIKNFLLSFYILIISITAHAEKVVNLYIWNDYIPDSVIAEFQQETGIKVNYCTYDSNETLYAKLKSNSHAGYDVIVPSTYYIDRMRREHMLMPLNKTKLTNFKNLNPALLNKQYDPHNNFSV